MRQTEAAELSLQAQGILEEHRLLRDRLKKVETVLSALRRTEATEVTELASCLETLAPLLRAHFTREEEEGLFDEVEETWPHAARACERLKAEHRVLLARLERLRTESGKGAVTAEALEALVVGARSLLKDLARHEELENQLICGSLDDAMAAQD